MAKMYYSTGTGCKPVTEFLSAGGHGPREREVKQQEKQAGDQHNLAFIHDNTTATIQPITSRSTS